MFEGMIRKRSLLLAFIIQITAIIFTGNIVYAAPEEITGSDLTYTLEDGVLTISGTGAMPDFTVITRPWAGDAATVTSVVVEDGVTSIGNYAFYQFTNLTSVTLPDSVIIIGNNSFNGCANLTSVTLPDNVKAIGEYAFYSCTKLTSITIPELVTSIERYTFTACSNLSNITIKGKLVSIDTYAFSVCTSLTGINLPDSVTEIGQSAFNGCTALESIAIPKGVNIIKRYTFSGCTGLKSVTMQDNVLYIDYSAFSSCNAIDSVKLSKKLQYLASGNEKLAQAAMATESESRQFVIKRYRDDATTGLYAGQLLYATPSDTSDHTKYIYNWAYQKGGYAVITPDTYINEQLGYGLGNTQGNYTFSLYGSAGSSATSMSCDAYYVNDAGKLVKAGTAPEVSLIQANLSHTAEPSEFSSSLGNLKVVMIEGETKPTLQQLLGRAGLMHVTCSATYVKNVTSSDESVVKITGTGKYATFEALQTGKSVEIDYEIYADDCTFHGTQYYSGYSSTDSYKGKLIIEVLGASARVTDDSVTLTINGLPPGETKCTIEGGETKIVTPDNNTVTFDNLGENVNNRIFIVTPDGAQATIVDGMTPDIKTVTVPNAKAPDITGMPCDLSWTYGDTTLSDSERTMSVNASVSDVGTLSYQWYKADTATGDGEAVTGKTLADIIIPAGADTLPGEYWYYCIVTNTLGETTAQTISDRGKLTVEKAEITIVPEANQGKVYGSADPSEYQYEVTGFVSGSDTKASVLTGKLSRNPGENVGSYAYTLGTLQDNSGNYKLKLDTAQAFTIRKKPLTVIPDADLEKIYGEADPVFTYTVTGLVNGDIADVVKGALSRNTGEDVGDYAYVKGSLNADNYDIVVSGDEVFHINKREITITAKNQKIVVGGHISQDKSQVKVTSDKDLAEGDNIESVTLVPSSETELTTKGTITPSAAVIERADKKDAIGNYDITYEDGKLTVVKGTTAVTLCPAATAITIGESLAESSLSGGTASAMGVDVKGTFTWYVDTIKPKLTDSNVTKYMVVFTPDDTVNYTTAVCPVTLTVNPIAAKPTEEQKASEDIKPVENKQETTTQATQEAQVIQIPSAEETTITPEQQRKNELVLNYGLKISQTGSKITIKWGKLPDADGYDVFVAYCGDRFKSVPTKTVEGNINKTSIKKLNGKKIKLKKNFKVYVRAYKNVNNEKVSLGKTITGHVVGRKNAKATNAKNIKVAKKKITLKKGKSTTIKAKTILVDKKKKQLSNAHATEFRYDTSDSSIATVSKKGKVTAIETGQCDIIVYSRNGYAKKVRVTVK